MPRKKATAKRRTVTKKARKPVKKSYRKAPAKKKVKAKKRAGVDHRPVLIKTSSGWRRPARSRLFKKPTKINPKRKYKKRRNPARASKILNRKYLEKAVTLGTGIGIGYLSIPLYSKAIPAEMRTSYDKFLGLGNVLIGILLSGFVKNKYAKEIGLTIGALGIYDLIASNTYTMLGLPPLPRSAKLVDQILPEKDDAPATVEGGYQVPYNYGAGYGQLNASYETPALSASYETTLGCDDAVLADAYGF